VLAAALDVFLLHPVRKPSQLALAKDVVMHFCASDTEGIFYSGMTFYDPMDIVRL